MTSTTTPPATAGRPQPGWRQRRAAFASAWLGWMLDGFETYAIVLVGGLVMADLVGPDASPMYFSVVLAVQLVAWAVGGLASGVLIDYFGRRRVLMYSILLYSVATGLAALAPNFGIFLALRVLAGFGMGAEWGPGSALVAESWPNRSRGRGVALLQSAFGVGFLLATGAFQLLEGTGSDAWRWMLLLGAVPALLVLVIRRTVGESELWRATDERRRAVARRARAGEPLADDERALIGFPLRRIFADPLWRSRLLRLLVLSAASLVGWWAVSTWIPRYVGEAVAAAGSSSTTVTLIVLAYNVGGVLGWLLWGVLADVVGRRWTLWGYYLGALSLTWLLFGVDWPSLGWLAVVVFVNGVFTLGQMGWMATYPAELFPTAVRGTAITTVFNGTRFIAAAGALLSGSLVAGLGGISTAALTIGSIYALGLVFALIAGPETRGRPLPD
ncbi:Predicted arabinose efflux permease, MFS family [Streptomyces zhaozhouensis]|uniref:Predicted arabinose efflux permease, MFS family n=1 Tax=Streptomyces zhaozhouensis TaxID=1300267 RepID=A0A286DTZ2_9ACTN|nr:MFS transporter [Streptomyces zhaozhouensis]SOD62137.1 Predicted arabinose efflux permease, MFS family [Streptomyces zhaozhouensis]